MITLVSYGGGTNSTALLIECINRRIRVDLILFADTGGEQECTYGYLKMFSAWLVDHGMPEITVVRTVNSDGEVITLEGYSLQEKQLPSLAYGFKSCSQKFKLRPQDKYMNNWGPAKEAWENGEKVRKFIGYDADEPHRAKDYSDKKYVLEYPLVEWDYGRDECVRIINNAGLPPPGKSSCFFCPSMRKHEILSLPQEYKDRAIAMEDNAELTTVKGLGRRFAWKDLIAVDEAQSKLFPEQTIDESCGCYDGGAEAPPE